MFVSIDDYYDVDFYNDSLLALEENGVKYSEHILFKEIGRASCRERV